MEPKWKPESRSADRSPDALAIRFHDLRGTWVTLARDAGVALEVVADLAGHDSRFTAQIYSEVTEARRQRAALELDDLLAPVRK